MREPFTVTILGQPASKSNRRRWVKNRKTGKMLSIKSPEALAYEQSVKAQVIRIAPLFLAPIKATIHIWYKTHQSDLDPSTLLAALQDRLYANDRAIKEMHLFHHIDKVNPRATVTLEQLNDQQLSVS